MRSISKLFIINKDYGIQICICLDRFFWKKKNIFKKLFLKYLEAIFNILIFLIELVEQCFLKIQNFILLSGSDDIFCPVI